MNHVEVLILVAIVFGWVLVAHKLSLHEIELEYLRKSHKRLCAGHVAHLRSHVRDSVVVVEEKS